MIRPVAVGLALLALSAAPVARAAEGEGPVVVFPFEGVDLPEATRIGAAQAFSIYLSEQGFEVLPVPEEVRPGSNLAIARDAAAEAGATHYVLGYVTRLGETSIVQVRLYPLPAATPSFADHLTVARLEDLEPALKRLARAAATGGKAAEARDIYTVTERESRRLEREKAAKYFGVRLGGISFLTGGPDELLTGAGIYGLYDARFALFDLNAHLFGGGGSGYGAIDLGGYYPLTDGTITPYLGGGLALSFLTPDEGNGGGGLGVFGGAGLILARTSSVNARVDLRYLLNTYETGSEDDLAQGVLFAAGLEF